MEARLLLTSSGLAGHFPPVHTSEHTYVKCKYTLTYNVHTSSLHALGWIEIGLGCKENIREKLGHTKVLKKTMSYY